MSHDPFPGWATVPASQHDYSYVQNNPVNLTDPTGNAVVKIWASAFIAPATITFPHFYPVPPFVYPDAVWHGDGRSFYTGGVRPSARVWHEVVINTNYDVDPCNIVPLSASLLYLTNKTGIGETSVTFSPGGPFAIPITLRGKAPAADKAGIMVTTDQINVHIEAHAANPLTPPGTPSIDYQYNLTFDLKTGHIIVEGEHDMFPWHELYVTVDGTRPTDLQVYDVPSGPSKTPGDLFFPPKPIKSRHAVVPALVK